MGIKDNGDDDDGGDDDDDGVMINQVGTQVVVLDYKPECNNRLGLPFFLEKNISGDPFSNLSDGDGQQ